MPIRVKDVESTTESVMNGALRELEAKGQKIIAVRPYLSGSSGGVIIEYETSETEESVKKDSEKEDIVQEDSKEWGRRS